ncbi:MAG: AAA family ATPase [Gemmatimonadota bacterium]
MLTRLKVSGFKNLIDVDLSFSPFTCIAGGNAVGKSNLFDAIMLLSALADRPLIEAAMSVRDEGGRASDVRTLFHSNPKGFDERMRLEAEMIVSPEGFDDLGQYAQASITFLRYSVELAYKPSGLDNLRPGIQLTQEVLEHINLGDASKHLRFQHNMAWRKSVVTGRRTSPFISTVYGPEGSTIRLHQEGSGGRTRSILAASLPRTVLSTVNAAESPTAVLVRREMQSWRLLQLEPTALRAPDSFTAPTHVSSDGSHIPATLYSLARQQRNETDPAADIDVTARISNRLSELVEDVRNVHIDRDDTRELLTLYVVGKDGTAHPARSLSDGTLRFLALAVLEADPGARGVLCFEEPENGIHPERIVAMIELLQDLAVDPFEKVSADNPLRQVIINTHSPTVVAEVPDESLLLAERSLVPRDGHRVNTVVFRPLTDTWRSKIEGAPHPIQRGRIISFLNPVKPQLGEPDETSRSRSIPRRVIERDDLRQLSLWTHVSAGGQ